MLRALIWLLASILMLTLLRGVIGIIVKAVGQLFTEEPVPVRTQSPAPAATGMGGELVQDPVCGVFVSPAVALKKSVRGETHFFCSQACRDKYS